MRYSRVRIDALAYELPPTVVTTASLEARLAPLYAKLRMPQGYLESLTGVSERRFWDPAPDVGELAARAARKAMAAAKLTPADIDAVVYGGVCRSGLEPATASAVAGALELPRAQVVHDVSNACLGSLTAVLDVANRIELGQIRTGLVVACESAREINEETLQRLEGEAGYAELARAAATFTGGSAATAIVLGRDETASLRKVSGTPGAKLLGATIRTAPEHHRLCRWGYRRRDDGLYQSYMETDAAGVLRHGLELGRQTWGEFLREMDCMPHEFARVIMHQVGKVHRQKILEILEVGEDRDVASYPYLGNTGSCAVPLTAALALERGLVRRGDLVAWLGIGSGLSCAMLALSW